MRFLWSELENFTKAKKYENAAKARYQAMMDELWLTEENNWVDIFPQGSPEADHYVANYMPLWAISQREDIEILGVTYADVIDPAI
jgi:neutral trehalase